MPTATIDRETAAPATHTNRIADEIRRRAVDCFACGDAIDAFLFDVLEDVRLDVVHTEITNPADLATLSYGPDWGSCYRKRSAVEATREQIARLKEIEDPTADVWALALEMTLPALIAAELHGHDAPCLADHVARSFDHHENGVWQDGFDRGYADGLARCD